jgi:hypothetical protein
MDQLGWKEKAAGLAVAALIGLTSAYFGLRETQQEPFALDFNPNSIEPNYASEFSDRRLNLHSSAARAVFAEYPNVRGVFREMYFRRQQLFDTSIEAKGNFDFINRKLVELLVYTFQQLGAEYFKDSKHQYAMKTLLENAKQFWSNDAEMGALLDVQLRVLRKITQHPDTAKPFASPEPVFRL